jgi:hypothetical protein
MRLAMGSQEHLALGNLISKYEALLARSASGDDCDDELDAIEHEFAGILKV